MKKDRLKKTIFLKRYNRYCIKHFFFVYYGREYYILRQYIVNIFSKETSVYLIYYGFEIIIMCDDRMFKIRFSRARDHDFSI